MTHCPNLFLCPFVLAAWEPKVFDQYQYSLLCAARLREEITTRQALVGVIINISSKTSAGASTKPQNPARFSQDAHFPSLCNTNFLRLFVLDQIGESPEPLSPAHVFPPYPTTARVLLPQLSHPDKRSCSSRLLPPPPPPPPPHRRLTGEAGLVPTGPGSPVAACRGPEYKRDV